MEDAPLASLSLTHVRYNPADPISYASAWLALVPQGLVVIYVTLMWASREIEIVLMFAGQMACELLNFGLKRLIREDRPKQMSGRGYGMPSSHSQFVAFFAVSLSLFLLLRHVPNKTNSYSPTTFLERLLLSLFAYLGAGAVAASRVYLNYHTPKQVWVGIAAGSIFAILWYLFTAFVRYVGLLEWALDLWILRRLRIRDLILTEDIQDAGWGRWEERRKVRSAKQADPGKKKS